MCNQNSIDGNSSSLLILPYQYIHKLYLHLLEVWVKVLWPLNIFHPAPLRDSTLKEYYFVTSHISHLYLGVNEWMSLLASFHRVGFKSREEEKPRKALAPWGE